jgi:hypothetical protein
VVARHREHGRSERAQQLGGAFELRAAAPVSEIARGDDEPRLEPFHEPPQPALDLAFLVCTHVQVGNMEEPGVHDRTRL